MDKVESYKTEIEAVLKRCEGHKGQEAQWASVYARQALEKLEQRADLRPEYACEGAEFYLRDARVWMKRWDEKLAAEAAAQETR